MRHSACLQSDSVTAHVTPPRRCRSERRAATISPSPAPPRAAGAGHFGSHPRRVPGVFVVAPVAATAQRLKQPRQRRDCSALIATAPMARRRDCSWAKATVSGGRMPPSSRRALSGRARVHARSSPRCKGPVGPEAWNHAMGEAGSKSLVVAGRVGRAYIKLGAAELRGSAAFGASRSESYDVARVDGQAAAGWPRGLAWPGVEPLSRFAPLPRRPDGSRPAR